MHHVAPGSVVLITGASGAIGSEIAARAAAGGATVGLHGRRPERVAAVAADIRRRIPEADLIEAPGDFGEPGTIKAVVGRVADAAGGLDSVIHCAITGSPGATGVFGTADPAAFPLHAALTLGIFQQLCFAALPHLAGKGGTIVGLASDAGRFAAPRQSVIGGAFGGIMSFVRNLAVEVSRDGVRVHCVSPGYVADTPIFERYAAEMGGRGLKARDRAGLGLPTREDVAALVLFLCGPEARRITGQVISVNGGLNA